METDSSDEDQNEGEEGTLLPKDPDFERNLKPQMDTIFAEIEKSLPTIDFDLSDLSSDSEEPVILHRSLLKSAEVDFDDEKDLDTSLSGESATDVFKDHPGFLHIPDFDKNSGSACFSGLAFDNDIAALLSACDSGHNEVTSWKDLEKVVQEDKGMQKAKLNQKDKKKEASFQDQVMKETQYKSEEQSAEDESRQVTVAETGEFLVAKIKENSVRNLSPSGGRIVDTQFISIHPTLSNVGSGTQDWSSDQDSNKGAEGEEMSSRQQRNKRTRHHKETLQQNRHHTTDRAMKYSSTIPRLSFDLLNNIDFDNLTLNNKGIEEWQTTRAVGSPDSFEEESDGLTVIQKLARCSMEQAGKPCDLSAFDPQTGASLVATTSTLSQSTVSLATSPSSLTSVNKCGLKEITGSSTGACPDTDGRFESNVWSKNKTMTDRIISSHSMHARHEVKQWSEPKTVYIDLRGFDQHREEEKECLASVKRVLGLEQESNREDSSDSEDDESWIQRRQRIKKSIMSRGISTSASSSLSSPIDSAKQSKQRQNMDIKNKSAVTTEGLCDVPVSVHTLPSSTIQRFDLNGATHTMTEEGHSLATTTFPLPTYSSMGVSTQEDDSDDKQRVEGDSRKLSPRSKVTDSCCKSKDQQNRFFAGDEKSSHQGTKRSQHIQTTCDKMLQIQDTSIKTTVLSGTVVTPTSYKFNDTSTSSKDTYEQMTSASGGNISERADDSCCSRTEVAMMKEQEREKQRGADRLEREKREKEKSAKLRMGHSLEGLRPTACVSGTQPCAENTPVLFDMNTSYEPRIPVLPTSLQGEPTMLITVTLSSNGEIAAFSSHANKSIDKKMNHLSRSYLSLVCWLLSLIPPNFDQVKQYLLPQMSCPVYPETFPPFHVIGMQQLWVNESLCLAILVCPSPVYCLQKDDKKELSNLRKTKKGDNTSKFYKFVDTFLSRNSLSSVRCWKQYISPPDTSSAVDQEAEEEFEPPLAFNKLGSSVCNKPLSSFMQIHTDVSATDKIFNKDVGFFWQTVDSQESFYEHGAGHMSGENILQNTVVILHHEALFLPKLVYTLLETVTFNCCDICGLRVLYPDEKVNGNLMSIFGTYMDSTQRFYGVSPALALAIRGPNAQDKVAKIIGPLDYRIAIQTDPDCLSAVFGNLRSRLNIHHVRILDHTTSELVFWFGGRISKGASMDVGLPYKPKDSMPNAVSSTSSSGQPHSKSKKGKRQSGVDAEEFLMQEAPPRPPAALSGTTKSHVILVIAPVVPVSVLGLLIQAVQQKAGFQPRGIRHLCLSVRRATNIGIPDEHHSVFCPGINLEFAALDSTKQQQDSLSPCTVLILERENASHHTAALCEMLGIELKSQYILSKIKARTGSAVETEHLLHVLDYSEALLATLGGHFSKCPEFDPCGSCGSHDHLYSNSELEQVVVLLLLGRELLKEWGVFLRQLQSQTSVSLVDQTEWCDYELLGIKWLPHLSPFQAREVTPFELGDKDWKSSVHFLSTAPALVLALRGVNAFQKLEHFLSLPEQTTAAKQISESATLKSCTLHKVQHPMKLMTKSADEAYTLLRLFFGSDEIFPDADCRCLLQYLPESRHYHSSSEWNQLRNAERLKSKLLPRPKDLPGVRQELIFEQLLSGPSPITTFLLIKPGAATKHLAKIVRKVVHEGFRIVGLHQAVMTRSLACSFLELDYQVSAQELETHLDYLTSAPSIYLCLYRENAVKKLIDLIGPEDPQLARQQNQFYWRGVVGIDVVHNGLYASRSYIESVWDQKTFFPDGLCCLRTQELANEQITCPAVDTEMDVNFAQHRHTVHNTASKHARDPQISMVHLLLMQTTCLVLPPKLLATVPDARDAPFVYILDTLLSRGFEVVGARMVWMNVQQAQQLLHVMHGGSFQAVTDLTSGPCLVLALDRDNAVLAFDITFGGSGDPGSVLSMYGKDIFRPADLEQANQLLALFFRELMPGSHMEIRGVQEISSGASSKSSM